MIIVLLFSSIFLFVITCLIIYYHNVLVRTRNLVETTFSSIDVMLRRRYNLIPNLVSTIKAYAQYEKQLFLNVTEIRALNYENLTNKEKEKFDEDFTLVENQIVYLSESYPSLKASENFLHLQKALNETEEQLAAARRAYNSTVTHYNNLVQSFPSNLIAKIFKHTSKPVYLFLPDSTK